MDINNVTRYERSMIFSTTVEGIDTPSSGKEVNYLYSAEIQDVFILNDGNEAMVRTGVSVSIPGGAVAIVNPISTEARVRCLPMTISPGEEGEIVLTVVNDGSIAVWVKPNELLASIASVSSHLSKVEKNSAKAKDGRTLKGDAKQADAGSSRQAA